MTIASARTKERLTLLLQEYFYTPSVRIDNQNKVINSKGEIPSVRVIEKKGRFIAEKV